MLFVSKGNAVLEIIGLRAMHCVSEIADSLTHLSLRSMQLMPHFPCQAKGGLLVFHPFLIVYARCCSMQCMTNVKCTACHVGHLKAAKPIVHIADATRATLSSDTSCRAPTLVNNLKIYIVCPQASRRLCVLKTLPVSARSILI